MLVFITAASPYIFNARLGDLYSGLVRIRLETRHVRFNHELLRAKALQTVYSFDPASKQCIIICEKADEINEVITKELGRA